jgi:arylsulfatase A-like enzyme
MAAGCRGRSDLDLLAHLDAADGVVESQRLDVGADIPIQAAAFGEGWSLRENGWGTTFAWATAPRATLRFFSFGEDTHVAFRAIGHTEADSGPQRVRLSVNGTFVAEQALPPFWSDYAVAVPAPALRPGPNELELDFAWVRAGGPHDPRTLAAAFDTVAIAPDGADVPPRDDSPGAWRQGDASLVLPPRGGVHFLTRLATTNTLTVDLQCNGHAPAGDSPIAVWLGDPGTATPPRELVRAAGCQGSETTHPIAVGVPESGVRDLYVLNPSPSDTAVIRRLTLRRDDSVAAPERLNLVLIVLDALRADHLGSHGYERATSPCLDAVAQRSTQFTNAFAQAPMTITSMASVLTGMYPPFHGATDRTPLGDVLPIWPALLEQHGYATVLVSANPFVGRAFGLARGFRDVFELFASAPDYPRGLEGVVRPQALVATATDWLSARRSEPFFMLLHFLQPHTPYAPPKPYWGTFGTDDHAFDGRFDTIAAAYQQSRAVAEALRQPAIDRYDDNIRYVDAAICRLMQQLDLLELSEHTAIVITADHGEQFLDHNGFGHPPGSMFDELLHVPLIVVRPGAAPGRRSELVEGVDIGPTMLELAGIDAPFGQGRSLLSSAQGDGRAKDRAVFAFSRREDWRTDAGIFSVQTVRTSRYKLIRQLPEKPDLLYDLEVDPRQLGNSAPQDPERVAQLVGMIEERLAGSVAQAAPAATIDPSTREHLRALGYQE